MHDSQAAICEIRAGRWVRNGSQIRSQVRLYVECHFCNSIQDLDIFLLQVKCFENFFSWFVLSRNFAFLPLNFYIYMYYISRARSKINTWETKDFFFIKESLLICFRSVPCFWILMSLLISWLRGLFNLLLLSESSEGDLKLWWMMMIRNSLYAF